MSWCYLPKERCWSFLPGADCGNAEQTPPETVIETPVMLTALLSEVNQTRNEKILLTIPGKASCLTWREWGHRHRWVPLGDWSPCRPGPGWTADSAVPWSASRAGFVLTFSFHISQFIRRHTLNTLSIRITRTRRRSFPALPMTRVSF